MPDIVLSNATELWKKVKPLTLTDTGISDKLRDIKTYNRTAVKSKSQVTEWSKKFDLIISYLNAQLSNKHVVKHAKAVTWLKDLSTQLGKEKTALTSIKFDANEEAKSDLQDDVAKVRELWNKFVKEPTEPNRQALNIHVTKLRDSRVPIYGRVDFHGVYKWVNGEKVEAVVAKKSTIEEAVKKIEGQAK